MEPIYIPQLLKLPEQTEEINFEELIAGLEMLTPARGNMIVSHRGSYLEVSVKVETILTLVCDRCLKNYNYRLNLETSEIIWLNQGELEEDTITGEKELNSEDLVESIPHNGYFDPSGWLYEQLSLAMPMRQLCSQDCQPPDYQNQGDNQLIDNRWSSLAALKEKLQ